MSGPKKRYGQNFLTSPAIAEKIAGLSGITQGHGVIEIGPGRGILTRFLAEASKKVVAVEIDGELALPLRERFSGSNVEIIQDDFLKLDIESLVKSRFPGLPVAVCANIPYNIAAEIVSRLLSHSECFDTITLMVQKEFAMKLYAKKGEKNYSRLSVLTSVHAEVKKLFDVKAASFSPKPKVNSAVVLLSIRKESAVNPKNKDLFYKIIDFSFRLRRKTVLNSLYPLLKHIYTKNEFSAVLEGLNIPPILRGEDLDIFDFEKISNKVSFDAAKLDRNPLAGDKDGF